MDVFDKFLYDEITEDYAESNLSIEDYEILYERFTNLEHVPEVKSYLMAMRYLGWGIHADPEAVITELKTLLEKETADICGLYYDLLLFENENNADANFKCKLATYRNSCVI